MNVFLENFDNKSDSGPNGFTRKLFESLVRQQKVTLTDSKNADLSFCLIQSEFSKKIPLLLRLDGIYFNSEQNYNQQNYLIQKTYQSADHVVFQTEFNKTLTEKWFGPCKNWSVIRNGTDLQKIDQIPAAQSNTLDNFNEIWVCASAWRPHKRLNENIRYFLERAPNTTALVVLGKDPIGLIEHPRIFYAGHVDWEQQISIYKRATTFVHLAWLDHCPNVVVDARAAGCRIVCATSGGTKEIAGLDATLIEEDYWNFEPIKLYEPPRLDFNRVIKNTYDVSIDLCEASNSYYTAMKRVLA